MPPALARAQIVAASRGYPHTFAVVVFVSTALLFALRDEPGFGWTVAAFAFHMAVSVAVLVRWKRQQARDWEVTSPAAGVLAMVVEAAAVALGWFVYLSVGAAGAPPSELLLIATITTGVIAVGALRFAPIPAASLTYLGTGIVVLGLLTIVSSLPLSVLLFLGIFALMLARSVLMQAAMVSDQFRSGQALALAAGERDLLVANAQREEWQRQAASAAEAARLQAASEHGRREEVERVARDFEQAFVETIARLGEAAGRTRGTADSLASTTLRTHGRIRGVAANAARADTGAAALLDESTRLGQSLAAVESRIAEQEEISGRMRALSQLADERFATLERYANGVDSIAETIGEVAARTRLLALNASIEAARAGDAGRGFSVVAQEVKALATQTASATSSIREQLSEITKAVASSASIVGDMRASFERIGEVAHAVEQAVARQGAVIGSIQRYVGATAELTTDLQDRVVDAGDASDAAAKLTAELGTATEDLVSQTQGLMQETLDFLCNLKAA
jgi:methyl-accepting chemotaxis protein